MGLGLVWVRTRHPSPHLTGAFTEGCGRIQTCAWGIPSPSFSRAAGPSSAVEPGGSGTDLWDNGKGAQSHWVSGGSMFQMN